MSDVISQMGSAIYARLDGQLSGSVYHLIAPQGAAYPFTVYQLQSALDEYTFDSGVFSADYVVKAVSNRQWPTEAITLYGSAHTAMQAQSLTMVGYQCVRCERSSVISPYRDPDGYWHVGGIYRVEAWET